VYILYIIYYYCNNIFYLKYVPRYMNINTNVGVKK